MFKFLFPIFLLFAPIAAFAQEQITLEASSNQGTFTVEMEWITADIGVENTLEIRFIEQETGKEVEDIVYDFRIEREGEEVMMRANQTSNFQSMIFDEPGSYTIFVNNIEGLGEDTSFSVQVTPELLPAWIMAGAFTAILALRKAFGR